MNRLSMAAIIDTLRSSRLHAPDFARVFSGTLVKLSLQFVLFFVLANTLAIADFGVFATVTSISLIASRATAFGLPSLALSAAASRPTSLGPTLASTALWFVVSAPLLLGLAALIHAFMFAERLPLGWFLMLMAADVFAWRALETVAIVNEGQRRFAVAAAWVVLGIALKVAAALVLMLSDYHDLVHFIPLYACATTTAAVLALAFGLPKLRYRLKLRLAIAQAKRGLLLTGSNVIFFAQNELDKTLVFLLAGDKMAGLYAISMRVVDLTAAPIRAFNQLMVQATLRRPELAHSPSRRFVTEAIIAAISALGIAAVGIALWIYPTLLGRNVATAAPLFTLLFAVAAVRALLEYHSELLFAMKRYSGQPIVNTTNAVVKLTLLYGVLMLSPVLSAGSLNAVFAVTYLVSVVMTHMVVAPPKPSTLGLRSPTMTSSPGSAA